MATYTNFAYSTVATAPSPATSGTSLDVASGDGSLFPDTPFEATLWPAGDQPLATNAEIVTVTGVSTDTLTIVRAQEGTTARSIATGYQIAATLTAKMQTVPVFSVRTASAQSITHPSASKIYGISTVDEDSAGAWVGGDNSSGSNSRYTPTKAGLWWVVAYVTMTTALNDNSFLDLAVELNGAVPLPGTIGTLMRQVGVGTAGMQFGMPQMIRVNGTTDYLELFCGSSVTGMAGKFSMYGHWLAP